MAENDYFDHTNLAGESASERVAGSGYTGQWVASSLAAGPDNADALINIIMNSEGDCKNVMNAAAMDIGVGYFSATSAQFDHYYTIDLGREN